MYPATLLPAVTGDGLKFMTSMAGKYEAKASITVKQADVCTRLIASTEKVTIPKEGGTETIDIDTDGGDVKVEATEGVTADYNNGKLTLTAPANEDENPKRHFGFSSKKALNRRRNGTARLRNRVIVKAKITSATATITAMV